MNRIMVLDGDVLCYYFAYRNEIYWDFNGDGAGVKVKQDRKALLEVDKNIRDLQKAVKADTTVVALSHPKNFRLDVFPDYKSNRKGKEKPELWYVIRDYIENELDAFPVRMLENLEGDDVLGLMATMPRRHAEVVMVSIDKDMKTIPGLLYNPNHPEEGVHEITPEYAAWFHAKQVLEGDPTDGYKGCPGIGPVKAEALLDGLNRDMFWDVIVATYESKGLTEADALVQARCAHILHHGDYDHKTGEVRLWEP